MPKITVISSGPLSTIQDEGRLGYMDTGFSPNGAMDTYSMKVANLLVGNAPGNAVIEMTFMGMELEFDCTSTIALTGADMQPEVNENPIEMYTTVEMHQGDILSLKMAQSGMRTYMAVAGGFAIPRVMGSFSTNLKCGLGGFQGRKLCAGDEIPLRYSIPILTIGKKSVPHENQYKSTIEVRVILGPQQQCFTDRGIQTFLSSKYTVSDQSDRMGVRLVGEKVENKNGVDIISDGITTGSIQIPASGTPIILMMDRQTTGGYAKIATVISADLKKVAQAKPGTQIYFKAINEDEAVSLLKKEDRKIRTMQHKMICSR